MLIAGKTPRDYSLALRWFLLAALVLSIAGTIGRFTERFATAADYLQALVLLLIGWAGWRAAHSHGFGLTQIAVVGLVLSFASHWPLPLFHSPASTVLLFVVNSIVFIAVALCGGVLSRKRIRSFIRETSLAPVPPRNPVRQQSR